MKTMTYAQKADLVAKCRRVFESVKRSNQVVMAESYCDRALKAISGSYELDRDIRKSFTDMDYRIKNKPRYRYDSRAGDWVTTDEYLKREYCRGNQKALDAKIDAMRAEASYKMEVQKNKAKIEQERFDQITRNAADQFKAYFGYRNASAYSYAEQQRRGMMGIAPGSIGCALGGTNPLTGW